MQELIDRALTASQSYSEYREHLTALLAEGKTTGPNQGEVYLSAATMNQSRMDRLDRKARFLPEMEAALDGLNRPFLLLAITEGWCGDAAQIIPLINHMAEQSDQLKLHLVLRDEHPELIDQFLTDGGRGIPKILFLDPVSHEVAADYGPRPAPAQEMAMDFKYKRGPYADYDAYNIALHTWYARDKTKTMQLELVETLNELSPAGA